MCMATGTQFNEGFAAALGQTPVSRERIAVEIRRAGLAPTAKPGGGRWAVHYEADHCVHNLLSVASLRPSDAPGDIRLLDALAYGGSIPKNSPAPGGQHLGLALVAQLNRLAIPLSKGEPLNSATMAWVKSWELTLCLDPAFAQIKMNNGKGPVAHFFHADDIGRPAPMRRLTILSGDVLLAVARLLADTLIHQNALAAVQFLDATKPALSETDQEKAGRILQDAPALSDDQTRSTESSYASRNLELSFS